MDGSAVCTSGRQRWLSCRQSACLEPRYAATGQTDRRITLFQNALLGREHTNVLNGAGRAAIHRYILPARPTAANSQHTDAAGEWVDGHFPFHRPCSIRQGISWKKSQLHKIAPVPFQHLFPFISHSLCLLPLSSPLLSPKSSQGAWGALLAPPRQMCS